MRLRSPVKTLVIVLSLLWLPQAFPEEEFSFDVSEFERKAFEFRGFGETTLEHFDLNPRAALYQLTFFDEDKRRKTMQGISAALELVGRYQKGIAGLHFRTRSEYSYTQVQDDSDHRLYEGIFSLQPNPGFTAEVGKKAYRWGKGIAWNPVAFVERAKDAGDPDLAREGFEVVGLDLIRSFDAPLQTVGFTPLVVPTFNGRNNDFGKGDFSVEPKEREDKLNPAAKLYLLYRDTDIDFVFLGKGAQTTRFGVDFAKNLAANFEIHGEWAYITDFKKRVFKNGSTEFEKEDVVNYLLGLRYRTEDDINLTLEYYRNGQGNNKSQQQEFYRRVHEAWDNDDALAFERLPTGEDLERGPFTRANPMRHYLYFRAGWREPFDILYFEPSVFVIKNLVDGSFSMTPELFYDGPGNFEFRARLVVPVGNELEEYGEKPNDWRAELRVRYYF